jgi:hypothetical protein
VPDRLDRRWAVVRASLWFTPRFCNRETMEQAHYPHWDASRLHFEFQLPKRELRYKELVLYISEQCVDDPTFSRLKLLKILFYSDFEAFGRYGTPITGMAYRKFPFGPAPVAFGRMEDEMLRDGLIRIIRNRVFDQMRQRVPPLQDPNFDLFSARDIAIVGEWMRFFWARPQERLVGSRMGNRGSSHRTHS